MIKLVQIMQDKNINNEVIVLVCTNKLLANKQKPNGILSGSWSNISPVQPVVYWPNFCDISGATSNYLDCEYTFMIYRNFKNALLDH